MEDVVKLLGDIKQLLTEISGKLDCMQDELYTIHANTESLDEAVGSINGLGLYSLSDIHNKMEELCASFDAFVNM